MIQEIAILIALLLLFSAIDAVCTKPDLLKNVVGGNLSISNSTITNQTMGSNELTICLMRGRVRGLIGG